MDNASEVQVLQERVKGLQEDLRLLRRDVESLNKNRFASSSSLRRILLSLLILFFSVGTFLSIRHHVSERWSDRNKPTHIHATGVDFQAEDGESLGSIDALAPTFSLRNRDTGNSLWLSSGGIQLDSLTWGTVNVGPDGLRLEHDDGFLALAPYNRAGTSGMIITTGRGPEVGGRRASLVLALADGTNHRKPRLLILDTNGQVVD